MADARTTPRWEELARAAANPGASGEEVELLRELLTFRLADSAYAIPVERVREIVRMRPLTPVPRVPEAILGVIALRGEIVQVVDLRMQMGRPTSEPSRHTRIIVLHGDDERVSGVLVDEVSEVMRVRERELRASDEGGAVVELCVRGDEFVSLVDLERVLDLGSDT